MPQQQQRRFPDRSQSFNTRYESSNTRYDPGAVFRNQGDINFNQQSPKLQSFPYEPFPTNNNSRAINPLNLADKNYVSLICYYLIQYLTRPGLLWRGLVSCMLGIVHDH